MTTYGKLSWICYILALYFIYIAEDMPHGSQSQRVVDYIALVMLLLGAFLAFLQNRNGIIGIFNSGEELTDEDMEALRKLAKEERKKAKQKNRE